MKKFSWMVALLIALAMGFALVGCGGEAPDLPVPPFDHNVLKITTVTNWSGLDITGTKDKDGATQVGTKFLENDEITLEVVALVDPEQILFTAPRFDWQQVGDANDGKVYQPTIGEKYEVNITLSADDASNLNGGTQQTGTPYNLRLRANKANASFVVSELIYLKQGAVEAIDLSKILADLEKGPISGEDLEKASKGLLSAVGNDDEHVKYEILGP